MEQTRALGSVAHTSVPREYLSVCRGPFLLALLLAVSSFRNRNSLLGKNLEKRGEGRNRTVEWGFCRALPYHLATPPLHERIESIFYFLAFGNGFVSPDAGGSVGDSDFLKILSISIS